MRVFGDLIKLKLVSLSVMLISLVSCEAPNYWVDGGQTSSPQSTNRPQTVQPTQITTPLVLYSSVAPLRADEARGERVTAVAVSPVENDQLAVGTGSRIDLYSISQEDGGFIFHKLWSVSTTLPEFTTPSPADEYPRSQVLDLEFSPNGELLASSLYDGRVILWDAHSGEEINLLTQEEYPVSSIAYDPTGKFLALGIYNGTVTIWNIEQGEVQVVLSGHTGIINSVEWSPDENRLASASLDNFIFIWNLQDTDTPEMTLTGNTIGVEAGINSLAWSSSGHLLASGGQDGEVIIWRISATSAEQISVLNYDTNAINDLEWAVDNRLVIAASFGKVLIWDTTAPEQPLVILAGSDSRIADLTWLSNHALVISGAWDGTVQAWPILEFLP